MIMNEQLLLDITDLLNSDGRNYSVFLRCYTTPINANYNSNDYIRQALGDAAVAGGIEAVMEIDVLQEVEAAISYAGDSDAGPSNDVIRSSAFVSLLAQLLSQLKATLATANRIERFWLSDGHPSYPVFWDFGLLLTCTDEVIIFIGASSD